ncbi:MAG: hypothetical protein ACP5OE_08740 [Thermodesulfobium sp.]
MYREDSESLKSYKTILSPIRGPNHNVSGIALRAHGIHVAYEIMILELKIHHWYVVEHENRGSA